MRSAAYTRILLLLVVVACVISDENLGNGDTRSDRDETNKWEKITLKTSNLSSFGIAHKGLTKTGLPQESFNTMLLPETIKVNNINKYDEVVIPDPSSQFTHAEDEKENKRIRGGFKRKLATKKNKISFMAALELYVNKTLSMKDTDSEHDEEDEIVLTEIENKLLQIIRKLEDNKNSQKIKTATFKTFNEDSSKDIQNGESESDEPVDGIELVSLEEDSVEDDDGRSRSDSDETNDKLQNTKLVKFYGVSTNLQEHSKEDNSSDLNSSESFENNENLDQKHAPLIIKLIGLKQKLERKHQRPTINVDLNLNHDSENTERSLSENSESESNLSETESFDSSDADLLAAELEQFITDSDNIGEIEETILETLYSSSLDSSEELERSRKTKIKYLNTNTKQEGKEYMNYSSSEENGNKSAQSKEPGHKRDFSSEENGDDSLNSEKHDNKKDLSSEELGNKSSKSEKRRYKSESSSEDNGDNSAESEEHGSTVDSSSEEKGDIMKKLRYLVTMLAHYKHRISSRPLLVLDANKGLNENTGKLPRVVETPSIGRYTETTGGPLTEIKKQEKETNSVNIIIQKRVSQHDKVSVEKPHIITDKPDMQRNEQTDKLIASTTERPLPSTIRAINNDLPSIMRSNQPYIISLTSKIPTNLNPELTPQTTSEKFNGLKPRQSKSKRRNRINKIKSLLKSAMFKAMKRTPELKPTTVIAECKYSFLEILCIICNDK